MDGQDELDAMDFLHALCGYVVATEPVGPGGEARDTLTVDETICGNSPRFTFASMLGEYNLPVTINAVNTCLSNSMFVPKA